MSQFFCYFRVSAAKSNRQGLYLESQQRAVNAFLEDVDSRVLGEFFELEKYPSCDRPQLDLAIEQCRQRGATLLLAKVGTLISNPDFVSRLAGSGVDFRACDCPVLLPANLDALLSVALFRREQIGRRIRLGLQAAKGRGKRLGSPGHLDEKSAEKGRVRGALARKNAADRFSRRFYRQITSLMAEGLSMNGVAAHFNREGIPTATGRIGGWSCATVRNLLLRAKNLGLDASG